MQVYIDGQRRELLGYRPYSNTIQQDKTQDNREVNMEIQKVSSGLYVMDGQSYDLQTLIMAIGFERADIIEKQIMEQAKQMKYRNKLLKALSNAMSQIQGMRDSKSCFNANDHYIDVPNQDGTTTRMSVRDFLNKMGIDTNKWDKKKDGYWGKDERQAAIEGIKGVMDSLNSDSQMDMIRLQGLVQKRDTTYEMITNLMKTDQKSKDAIVANLR